MDRAKWANDLFALAGRLDSLTSANLREDEDLYEVYKKAIHRFAVQEDVSQKIEDQVQYPPEWDNLEAAVAHVAPNALLDNMWGWVAAGRWVGASLADVHEKGWLAPALRRLASHIDELDLQPGVDF